MEMHIMDIVSKAKKALLCMQRYSWEQGCCAQAFLESGDMDEVACMVYDAINRQTEDGRLANIGYQNGVTDPMSILEALVATLRREQDGAYRGTEKNQYKDVDKGTDNDADKVTGKVAGSVTGKSLPDTSMPDITMLENALARALKWALADAPRSRDGIVYHVDNACQFWVDSMYMLPPGLLMAGYEPEAVRQADGYIEKLYNYETSLFRHIWDETSNTYKDAGYWGVGNGWALCGLARMIEGLRDENVKTRYAGIVKRTVNAAFRLQRDDMLFHNILDDPHSFVETNFAQMLCYTVKKGVAAGWLGTALEVEPEARLGTGPEAGLGTRLEAGLMQRVEKTLDAVLQHVDRRGVLHDVCGAPSFDKPGVASEGQAFFILSRL